MKKKNHSLTKLNRKTPLHLPKNRGRTNGDMRKVAQGSSSKTYNKRIHDSFTRVAHRGDKIDTLLVRRLPATSRKDAQLKSPVKSQQHNRLFANEILYAMRRSKSEYLERQSQVIRVKDPPSTLSLSSIAHNTLHEGPIETVEASETPDAIFTEKQERKPTKPTRKKKKRRAVSAEVINVECAEGILSNYKPPVFLKDNDSRALISTIVNSNLLFAPMKSAERSACIDAFYKLDIQDPGDRRARIINQGDDGEHVYIVESGKVDIWVSINGDPEIKVNTLGRSACFGELTLMYNAPRNASVVASSTPVSLWCLDRKSFQNIGLLYRNKFTQMAIELLGQVHTFKSLDPHKIRLLASALEEQHYEEEVRKTSC